MLIIGITSPTAVDKAMYSASVVESNICVWSFEPHAVGEPANIITYPLLDFAVLVSLDGVKFFKISTKIGVNKAF